jgi:hypothetical protein
MLRQRRLQPFVVQADLCAMAPNNVACGGNARQTALVAVKAHLTIRKREKMKA